MGERNNGFPERIQNAMHDWKVRAEQLEEAIQATSEKINNFDDDHRKHINQLKLQLKEKQATLQKHAVERDEVLSNLEKMRAVCNDFEKQAAKEEETLKELIEMKMLKAENAQDEIEKLKASHAAKVGTQDKQIERLKDQVNVMRVLKEVADGKLQKKHYRQLVEMKDREVVEKEIEGLETRKKEMLRREKEFVSEINMLAHYNRLIGTGAIKNLNDFDDNGDHSPGPVFDDLDSSAASEGERSMMSMSGTERTPLVLDAAPGEKSLCKFEDILFQHDNKQFYTEQTSILSISGHKLGGNSSLNFLQIFTNRLEFLDLSRNNLRSSTAKEKSALEPIFNLSKLKVLNLSGNFLCQIPEGVGRLEKLEDLDVSGNAIPCRLKALQVAELKRLPVLFSLSCNGNPVTRHEHYRKYLLKHLHSLVKLDSTMLSLFDFGIKNYDVYNSPKRTRLPSEEELLLKRGVDEQGEKKYAEQFFNSPAMKKLEELDGLQVSPASPQQHHQRLPSPKRLSDEKSKSWQMWLEKSRRAVDSI
jgi:hypothetical protein